MECAFRPVITPETVADGLNNIENDLMYLKYDQCREKEVLELACQAAYRGNTLGLPRLMPEEILEKSKNKEKFHYFHFLTPICYISGISRSVICGKKNPKFTF